MTHCNPNTRRLAVGLLLLSMSAIAACSGTSASPGSTTSIAVATNPTVATTTAPSATEPPTTTPPTTTPSTTTPPTTTTEPAGSPTSFVVDFNQPPVAGPIVCAQAEVGCIASSTHGTLPVAGDWTGSMVSSGADSPGVFDAAGRNIGSGLIQFVGEIAGCGTGSVVLTSLTITTPGATFVVGDQTAFDLTRWEVVPGTGTDDLANLTGTGSMTAIVTPSLSVTTTYSGTINCG